MKTGTVLSCLLFTLVSAQAEIRIGWGSQDGRALISNLHCALCHDPGPAWDQLLIHARNQTGALTRDVGEGTVKASSGPG